MSERTARISTADSPQVSRRTVLGGLAMLAATPMVARLAYGQAPGAAPAGSPAAPMDLPLKLTGLIGHIGVSVRDVIQSATFYSKLVGGNNVNGEKQPFLRYFMNLNPGSVAIGKLGTLGSVGQTKPLIDHFCVTAAPFNDAAWRARLKAEGLMYIAQGVFLDIDNIPIQVSGGEGGESLSAGTVTKLDSLYTGEPLIKTHGYEHVMLRVRDLDKTAAFWKKTFGFPASARNKEELWISDGMVRLGFRTLQAGEQPGIEHYALRTDAFNGAALGKELVKMGATAGAYDKKKQVYSFEDPDGLKVQLWPGKA